ncbi:MAG: hypothetical protein PHP87_06480 [Syntrophomonas sp.]|uniref:hypothetical protein n=1 Tax=Syntrophomonas sp. TaxID=2053627 RepID=UPI0026245F44|nr:hypothetical protein [Syntrophomonas sp.]MDD4626715.1 hypothetical protein [Syntrophomonas sp.]
MPRIEELCEQVVSFCPVYTGEGNCTEILLHDGCKVIDQRSLNSVRRALARCYSVDLEAQGKEISLLFGRRSPLPFYLPPKTLERVGRVFIPFRMRRPRVHHDAASGFYDISYITRPEAKESGSLLHLSTGSRVKVFGSLAAARANIFLGRELADHFGQARRADDENDVLQAVTVIGRYLQRIEERLSRLV